MLIPKFPRLPFLWGFVVTTEIVKAVAATIFAENTWSFSQNPNEIYDISYLYSNENLDAPYLNDGFYVDENTAHEAFKLFAPKVYIEYSEGNFYIIKLSDTEFKIEFEWLN